MDNEDFKPGDKVVIGPIIHRLKNHGFIVGKIYTVDCVGIVTSDTGYTLWACAPIHGYFCHAPGCGPKALKIRKPFYRRAPAQV